MAPSPSASVPIAYDAMAVAGTLEPFDGRKAALLPFFQDQPANLDSTGLRDPQIEGYAHVAERYLTVDAERETALVLPVGCGKSGLITILPFAERARRALVIAPNLRPNRQLSDELDPGDQRPAQLRADLAGDVS